MGNILSLLDTNSPIKWWNENRKMANTVIKMYNKCLYGKCNGLDVYNEFKLVYKKLEDCYYSEDFDIIATYLESQGFNMDFYDHFN